MHEIIYNIYIGGAHWETCIDEEGLAYCLNDAKSHAKSIGKSIHIEEEKVPYKMISDMIDAKIADNRKMWEEADRLHGKNPKAIEWIAQYHAIKDCEKINNLIKEVSQIPETKLVGIYSKHLNK